MTALLVLLQLQPVLGTVACLGLTGRQAGQECAMPEHGQSGTTGLVPAGPASQGCQAAAICTPVPPAVSVPTAQFETAESLRAGAGALAATLPRDIPPVPPFHPPRA